MSAPSIPDQPFNSMTGILRRAAILFGLWIILMGLPSTRDGLRSFLASALPDLLAGCTIAGVAALVSVRLAPSGPRRISMWGLALFAIRMVGQASRGGFDVARRALDPRLPIEPGLFDDSPRFSDAHQRGAFMAMTSLVPGTLPLGSTADGRIRYHALDTRANQIASLDLDEGAFARIWVESGRGEGRSLDGSLPVPRDHGSSTDSHSRGTGA